MTVIDAVKSNIIHLGRARSDFSGFPALAQVQAYWQALSGGKVVPRRADVDPRALELALAFCFILQQVAPGVFRIRIAGRHLNDLMGLDVRGMPLSAMFRHGARDELGRVLEDVCSESRISELELQGDAGFGRPELFAKMLLMPLCDETGRTTRVLGCVQSNGRIGRQPRRFSIRSLETTQAVPKAATFTSHYNAQTRTGFAGNRAQCIENPAVSARNITRDQCIISDSASVADVQPSLRLVVSNS